MEAIFGLLRANPADEELLTAACAVCEQLSSWSELLSVISKESTSADFTCKAHLRTLSRCLKNTKLSEWPLQHIERVLVASLPRWGSLIPKDSLSNIFEFLGVVVTHGLGILNVRATSVSPGIPRSVHEEISAIRLKLLQLIWFSSALSTLTTVLKCTVGEGEGDIVNVLLQHNSDSESLKQTVVEAQEQALICLGSLFECVSFSNHDESLDQLSQVLKQLCCDFQDSSSLPLVLSVSSFIVGASKVKVRAETVDAAAFCLAGIVKVCDLSPSLFQQSTRVKGEDIIGSCLDGISVACVDLLESLSVNLPSLCVGSKSLIEGVQTLQSLHRVSNRLIPDLALPISIPADVPLTSGAALALSRSGDKERISDFLTKSVLDKEWLKSHFMLPRENVKDLSNLYSLLQSEGVRPEWIFSKGGQKFSEPSLRHFIPTGKRKSSNTLPDITAILSQLASCEAVIDACNALLISFFDKEQQSEMLVDLKNAVLSLLSEVEIDAVRETPQLVDKTLRILELICQQEISKGLPLTQPEAISPGAEEIVTQLVLSTLSFSRNPSHCPLINQALRCVPYFAPGKDSEIISAIIESVNPALALSSCPAALNCLECILTAVERPQPASMEYVSSLLTEFASKNEILPDSVVVELLSLTSSFLLNISDYSNPSMLSPLLNSKSVWTLLATHPAIRSAATARSWDQPNAKYSSKHLVWIHALHLAEVLLSLDLHEGADKFIHSFTETLSERYLTAHTSDLASLEEACLISRIAELSGLIRLHPFQFTSLVTPKPPSLYPKSRAEKLAGGLPTSNISDDVRLPCEVPSVFAQRVVWIAADILSSALRNISRNGASDEQTTQTLFHSLLDCSHFFVQYLNEVSTHKARVLQLVHIGADDQQQDFVPLSVHLSVDGRDLGNTNTLPPNAARTSTGGGSLLHSMSSPLSTAKKATLKNDAPASLMDSLTPRNSPKSQPVAPGEDIRFLPAVTADCSLRSGLTFIAPSLVSEEDFVSKLVQVLSLCLILATRLATTEALIRPLLDLLLTTQSNKDRLPIEALDIISELVKLVTPRYEQFAALGRSRTAHQSLPGKSLISPQFPAITSSTLGYSALNNIR